MKLTAAQKREVERMTRAGYRVIRQMDSKDADWQGQAPDVIMEAEGNFRDFRVEISHVGRVSFPDYTTDVDYSGKWR